MIRSMTGFGEASEQNEGIHYAVELRSLNNRFFKAAVRLPEPITGLEAELEILLRKRLTRGSITLTVRTRDARPAAPNHINETALLAYLGHLDGLSKRLATDDRSINIDLISLLALPGVLQPEEDEQQIMTRARPVVAQLAEQACERLMTMRATEGRVIAADLAQHGTLIRQRLDEIKERAPVVIEEYHLRLRSRIDDLIARAKLTLEQRDLIHEVAIFAERADISEEVNRMSGHMEQIDRVIQNSGGEPAGRTLDFLAQELLREANTIASKSNDGQISRAIVEVKGTIERIKEQVQNVE